MEASVRTIVEALRARRPLQPLSPRATWDSKLEEAIDSLQLNALQGQKTEAEALRSGLHLWNDNLDRSHTISQDIETQTGSYWHGIMHRMEGDYSNAKYWFRETGKHPAMRRLHLEAAALLSDGGRLDGLAASGAADALKQIRSQAEWNPFLFIDAVAAQERGSGNEDTRELLEELQQLELSVLIESCYEAAVK